MKLEFSQRIFEKSSNIKLHENLPSGSQVGSLDEHTDRHNNTNSCFLQFCKFVYKSVQYCLHRTGEGMSPDSKGARKWVKSVRVEYNNDYSEENL